MAVARCRRPARGGHRQAAGSPVAPGRAHGARPEHPDRNAGAVHPLLPDGQHAGSRSPSGRGPRPGQGAFRAIRGTAWAPPAARPKPGARRSGGTASRPDADGRRSGAGRSTGACLMSAVPQTPPERSSTAASLDRRIQMLRTAMGPVIASALADPDVVEIMLNPDRTLWVDRLSSGRTPLGLELPEADGERIIRLVAAHVGAEVHRGRPLLTAELPETGERFEGILPPAAPGPAFALRKRAVSIIGLDRYVADGILTTGQADFLRRAVRERQNILIAGATSSGKTTLANALLAEIAATGDRVLVLEDTIELQCAARDHVPLRTRAGVVSMTELVRATMRLRPDRVIVGEVRGGEALDLVKVWGTGHPGGIATIHAGSALGALLRLEQLILEVAVNPPRALIAEAVNVVIHIAGRGRKRRVESVARVVGFDRVGYRLADALETPFPELMPVPLAADAAAPSPSPDQPGELP